MSEDPQVCRICGCTDDRACDGGCSWAEPGLCSACVAKAKKRKKPQKPPTVLTPEQLAEVESFDREFERMLRAAVAANSEDCPDPRALALDFLTKLQQGAFSTPEAALMALTFSFMAYAERRMNAALIKPNERKPRLWTPT